MGINSKANFPENHISQSFKMMDLIHTLDITIYYKEINSSLYACTTVFTLHETKNVKDQYIFRVQETNFSDQSLELLQIQYSQILGINLLYGSLNLRNIHIEEKDNLFLFLSKLYGIDLNLNDQSFKIHFPQDLAA